MHCACGVGGSTDTGEALGMRDERGDLVGQSSGVELILLEQYCCTDVAEGACIPTLVVVGGIGPRHHDGGGACGGQFGNGAGATAGDHEVAGGVQRGHPVFISDHGIHDARWRGARAGHLVQPPLAHHVIHEHVGPRGPQVDHASNSDVHHFRAERPAEHTHHEPIER